MFFEIHRHLLRFTSPLSCAALVICIVADAHGAESSDIPPVSRGPNARPEIRATRVAQPPVLDGRLDDLAWELAEASESLTQVEPDIGGEPTERTEFRIVYDDDALYIGLWCFDRDPDGIIARELGRDGNVLSEDHVIIVLDPFLDRRNGYEFLTNPNGVRADALITNNVNLNGSWDGIWVVKARIDDEGWKAEARGQAERDFSFLTPPPTSHNSS